MSLEKSEIERALRDAGGKIGRAARLLGASRRTLQNRMRFLGMERGRPGRPKRRLAYHKHRRTALVAGGLAAAAAVALLVRRRPGRVA